jgi:hypothetical protein
MKKLTIRETREAMAYIQRAADILQHPRVSEIHFALPSANLARVLREIIGRLKQRNKSLTADEIRGITHALQTAADFIQADQIATLGYKFPDGEDVARNLRGIVMRIKMLANKSRS